METDLIQLVRANADGMLVLDASGDVRHANPAAARLLGRDADALLGQPFGIPLASSDAEAEPEAVEVGIHRPHHPDQPEGTAELRCSPCRWEGRPATLVSLRDVTDRKEWVAKLRETRRRLRRLSAALQQAQLAERLRVSGLVEEAVEQPIRRARAEARAAAKRAAGGGDAAALERVVAQLDEALQAAEAAREELFPPDLLDGGGLAPAARWLAGRVEARHGLRVRVVVGDHFEEPADPRLRGFLFDAVRELLDNVAQHAGVFDAEVRLTCDGGGGEDQCPRLAVEVSDRGVGYATTRPNDPRPGDARRRLRGLGLFNLQETLADRGGDLTIRSGPGEGTRVRLSVPVDAMRGEPGPEAFPPEAAAAHPAAAGSGPRGPARGDRGGA